MSKLKEQLDALQRRYDHLKSESLKDGQITPDEESRLDAIQDTITRVLEALLAQGKLIKTMTGVAAKLKTDPTQVKAFQDGVKALSPDAQKAAAEVLKVLYASPRPASSADERKQLRDALGKLPAGDSMAVGRALNKLGVYLPNLKEDSPGAEDASARIKKVYMGEYNVWNRFEGRYVPDSGQDDYVRDMILQAKAEGFKVVLQVKKGRDVAALKKLIVKDLKGKIADEKELDKYCEIVLTDPKGYVWAEDNKWLSVDGSTIKTTPDIPDAELRDLSGKFDAFTSALRLKPGDPGFAREGHHTAAQPHNDPVSSEHPAGLVNEFSAQGAVANRREHISAAELAKVTGKKVDTTRTYNEGGNMLVGTLPNGQPYAVIGRDGLLMSVIHLEQQYKKDPAKVPEFDPANVAKRMGTMKFDADEVLQTIQQLNAAGMMPAAATTPADKEKVGKQFLAKIDLVKDIFADDTEIPRDQLVFVPQPDFHVDMHMRPAGPGQIMVNDFRANIVLIDEALKKTPIQPWEVKQLQSMRDHAVKMEALMKDVNDEIEKQCKKSGLEVVRAPGVMEGNFEAVEIAPDSDIGKFLGLAAARKFKRDDLRKAIEAISGHGLAPDEINDILNTQFTRHVNFMNAIPGTKEGTNEQFYMTNFTTIGPLRDAYKEYLKGQGFENVEWMGDHGGGEFAQSTSEVSLNMMGGLDCRENH